MSDMVAQRILELLKEQDGFAEIKRGELAEDLGCVPSQINYVLTSRFTPEHGYTVESRRGGGGYIRIRRVEYNDGNARIMHIVNSIGKSVNMFDAGLFLKNMEEYGYISPQAHIIIRAATSDNALASVPQENKDEVRAAILKNCLLSLK